MLLAFGTMAADGAARLALRPRARVLLLGAVLLALASLLASGWWGRLSLLQEYAAHRDGFWAEAATHVALAFGSLLVAVLVGLPLGIGCARRPPPARRSPAGAQRDPDDPLHRHVRADDGAARPPRRRGAAPRRARHPRHRRGPGRAGAVPLRAAAGGGQHGGGARRRAARRRRSRARHGHGGTAGGCGRSSCLSPLPSSSPASASCWCRTSGSSPWRR